MIKILIADDHSFIRIGLIRILKDKFSHLEITEVDDGEALVSEVMKNRFDIVISDLDMPGRSGIECLAQIKLIDPHIKVLILSIYPEELYAVRVLKAGAFGYMNKNAAPQELVSAVEKILAGKKYITAKVGEQLLEQSQSNDVRHQSLSDREFEIFKLLADGKTLTEISKSLCLALTTVSTYKISLMKKLGLKNASEITRYAIAHNIIADL